MGQVGSFVQREIKRKRERERYCNICCCCLLTTDSPFNSCVECLWTERAYLLHDHQPSSCSFHFHFKNAVEIKIVSCIPIHLSVKNYMCSCATSNELSLSQAVTQHIEQWCIEKSFSALLLVQRAGRLISFKWIFGIRPFLCMLMEMLYRFILIWINVYYYYCCYYYCFIIIIIMIVIIIIDNCPSHHGKSSQT